jgi:cyclic 2,3-diphosphoglycerate synthetase
MAGELGRDLVVFDGSGAALPPVAARRTIAVVGAHQDPGVAAGYLNEYRLLLADLVILTMAETGTGWERVRDAVGAVVRPGVEVVPTVLRPRPAALVRGRSVAYFSTAPASAHAVLESYLRLEHGARVVHMSGNLGNRDALREELPAIDAEVYLVELKAAAVDVVAEHAVAAGAEVVLSANDVSPVRGHKLDEVLLEMAGISL